MRRFFTLQTSPTVPVLSRAVRLCIACGVLSLAGHLRADPLPHVNDILAKWRQRESRLDSVRIEWDERLFCARGSSIDSRVSPDAKGVDTPAEDSHFEFPASVLLSRSDD